MNIDLALLLVIATAISGTFVALGRFVILPATASSSLAQNKPLGLVVDYARSFFPVLLIVLVIRSFIFEPYRIPSASMMPTLVEGDFIFVKKYAYGLKLPVLNDKVLATGEPSRGDVAVFRLPQDPSINYIKRVVGLPGDKIVYEKHRILLNGNVVALSSKGDGIYDSKPAEIYEEQLDSRVHDILVSHPQNQYKDGVFVVPDGHYFVLGDNRDNSQDSRFIGYIPETLLVGEAVRIWMNWRYGQWPVWERIGNKIQ